MKRCYFVLKSFFIMSGFMVVTALPPEINAQTVPANISAPMEAPSRLTAYPNSKYCGNAFEKPEWWPRGHYFAFEVQDQGVRGLKVKTLVLFSGQVHHLECQRGLKSKEECFYWLSSSGYKFHNEGTEFRTGGSGGNNRTIAKGPLFEIPQHLKK